MPDTRMDIRAATPREPKEIKIRLSHEMCVRLHSLKILNGVTIAETVSAALEAYFDRTQGAQPIMIQVGDGRSD